MIANMPQMAHTTRMADTLGTFRSMLSRPVTVDEALSAYMGRSAYEADRQAEDERTGDGMFMARLRDLVTILALREAPSDMAMLAASLLWRSAPVATSVDELIEAIARICTWRSGLDDRDVARIIHAHRVHAARFEEAMDRARTSSGPEIDGIMEELSQASHGDTVVAELGCNLLIVEMTDTDFFVGIQDECDVTVVIDRVPHAGGGGWGRDGEDGPVAPRSPVLIDA